MEYFGLFAAIIGLITICSMLFYVVIRAVDYAFTKKDDDRRFGYRMSEIGYAGKQGKMMCNSMVKHINDGVIDMFRKMTELE